MSTRRALVDTSLMARASTRRFLGLLAEAKGVMLVSTQETQEELPRALHRVVASRNARHNFDMKLREEQQSLRLWQKRYMESGLYQQLDLSHTPLSDTDFAFLSERWEATRSDPDDFHLAYKDRALGWAHALAHSFPTMKKSLLEHVERMSEHDFYMLHQKALGFYEIPITRQAMSIESRS